MPYIDDDEPEEYDVGECGLCHTKQEIVASMTVAAKDKEGATIGQVDLDVCETCVRKTVEEHKHTAHHISLEMEDGSTEVIRDR